MHIDFYSVAVMMDPERNVYKQIDSIVSLYYHKNMRWSTLKSA